MNGLEIARAALAQERAWLVGGAVRDRALGRSAGDDLDIVVEGDPGRLARQIATVAREHRDRAACFALSEEFGGWRVVGGDHAWQIDVEPLRGDSLEADLRLRDLTVNAIAEPIEGGDLIDPLHGLDDLAARRLRAVSERSFVDDPLRVLRLARIAVELHMEPDTATTQLAKASAAALSGVAAERSFAELTRIVDAEQAVRGLRLLSDIDASRAVLPELEDLAGVEQSRYHHTDVHGHTIEVLERAISLQRDPVAMLGAHGPQVRELLSEPLADRLTRGSGLRWGALLHDIAKPRTRAVRPRDGRVTFLGHDELGAEMAMSIMRRLRASERFARHVAALVRHHLRLGFLLHEPQPLSRRTVFAYMRACEPVQTDVTVLSVADRLATRGAKASEAIASHLALAEAMLGEALRWRSEGAPKPLLAGDLIAKEAGIEPGPRLGELVEELVEAQYAGEVLTTEQAIAWVRHVATRHAAKDQ